VSIKLVLLFKRSVNNADVTVNLTCQTPRKQGLIWPIITNISKDQIDWFPENVLAFFPNGYFLTQRLFLPQLYEIETLITQSAIYTPKSPKFPPIISGLVLPKFKKLQTLIFSYRIWKPKSSNCVGSELRLIRFVMIIICLFEVFNMVLYCFRCV
jgi:hypothetical protein